jgi:predicted nucleotidyltransferase
LKIIKPNIIEKEAAQITSELGDIVFIGAVAVLLHTKGDRESRDLDFAVAVNLPDDFLKGKGYSKHEENRKLVWYTPRRFKIDIYTGSIKDVTIETMMSTAKTIVVNQKRNWTVKVVSLEVLIVLKHRAGRNQDIGDIKTIAERRFNDIDWNYLESLTYDKTEFLNIKTALEFHYKNFID